MRRTGGLLVFALIGGIPVTGHRSQEPDTISLRDRVVVASRIFQQVKAYFPDLSDRQFDRDYDAYVDDITKQTNDRRAFDLASMALVATLHDSHSWFYDDWLDQRYGKSIGLTVYRWGTDWVVVRSRIESIPPGSLITAVDGVPIDAYFERQRRYIAASSERDATTSLFDTPALFPTRFTLTLDGARSVVIDRATATLAAAPPPVDGRWLIPGRVGYVRMSAFQGIETGAAVWRLINAYRGTDAVILDLRGNIGAGDPRALQQALMDRAYPMWSETAAMSGGAVLRGYGVAHPVAEHVMISDADGRPRGAPFSGRLILVIDRGCTCACEDFTMPFKVTGRATLVGETTAGTFSFTSSTQFANGMRLNMAAVRHTFPDGARFEGVGIAPDVAVAATPQDLRNGRDVVLDRARALASER